MNLRGGDKWLGPILSRLLQLPGVTLAELLGEPGLLQVPNIFAGWGVFSIASRALVVNRVLDMKEEVPFAIEHQHRGNI